MMVDSSVFHGQQHNELFDTTISHSRRENDNKVLQIRTIPPRQQQQEEELKFGEIADHRSLPPVH